MKCWLNIFFYFLILSSCMSLLGQTRNIQSTFFFCLCSVIMVKMKQDLHLGDIIFVSSPSPSPPLSLCMLSSRPAGIDSLPPPLQPDSDKNPGMSANWAPHRKTQSLLQDAQLVISFPALRLKKESGYNTATISCFFLSFLEGTKTWRSIKTR